MVAAAWCRGVFLNLYLYFYPSNSQTVATAHYLCPVLSSVCIYLYVTLANVETHLNGTYLMINPWSPNIYSFLPHPKKCMFIIPLLPNFQPITYS